MRFEQLYDANVEAFYTAADRVRRTAERVRDGAVDWWTQVVRQLEDTSESGLWGGPAANAAQVPMKDAQLACNRAADQLEALPSLLEGYASELAGLKAQLHSVVDSARTAGVEVGPTGTLTVSAEAAESAVQAGRPHLAEDVREDPGRGGRST